MTNSEGIAYPSNGTNHSHRAALIASILHLNSSCARKKVPNFELSSELRQRISKTHVWALRIYSFFLMAAHMKFAYPHCYIASFFLNLCLGTKIEEVRRGFEMLYQRHSDLGTRMLKIEKSSFHLVPNHEPLKWLIKKNLNTYLTSDCAKWTRYGDILSRFSVCIKNKSKCLDS